MSTIQNRNGALFRVERITNQQSAEGAVRCLELVDEHGATCYVPTSSLQAFFDLDLDGALELVEALRDDVDEARAERDEAQRERNAAQAHIKMLREQRIEIAEQRDAARDELDVVKAERDKLREALADARRMEGEK